MFKHANTFAPGDKVQRKSPHGTKLATEQSNGEVTGLSDNGDAFRVRFLDGSVDYVKHEDLALTHTR